MFPENNGRNKLKRGSRQNWDGPPRWLPNVRVLLFVLVLLMLFQLFIFRSSRPALTISYSVFLNQVRAGNVAEVEIVGQEINGNVHKPLPRPAGAETGRWMSFVAQPTEFERFTTTLPPVVMIV